MDDDSSTCFSTAWALSFVLDPVVPGWAPTKMTNSAYKSSLISHFPAVCVVLVRIVHNLDHSLIFTTIWYIRSFCLHIFGPILTIQPQRTDAPTPHQFICEEVIKEVGLSWWPGATMFPVQLKVMVNGVAAMQASAWQVDIAAVMSGFKVSACNILHAWPYIAWNHDENAVS